MNSSEITSKEATLKEILNGSKGLYKVSTFQRPYAWEIKQQQELLSDFMNSIKRGPKNEYIEGDFFLGNFIFYKKGKNEIVNIVDGQQRLITTSIILVVIRDYLFFIYDNKRNNSEAVESAQNLLDEITPYLYVKEDGELYPVITPLSKYEEDYFFQNILHLDEVDFKMEKDRKDPFTEKYTFGYNLIKDIISEKLEHENAKCKVAYLRILYRQIIQSEIVAINIPEEERAYKIYSNINSKGLYLSQTDLIKNDILYKTKDEEIPGLELHLKKWENIIKNVARNTNVSFEEFYRYSWFVIHTEDIKENYNANISLFEIFQNKYKSTKDNKKISRFISELELLSKEINRFSSPNASNSWKKDNWPNYTKKLIFINKVTSDSISNKYILYLLPIYYLYLKDSSNRKYSRYLKKVIELLSDTIFIYKLCIRHDNETLSEDLESFFNKIYIELIKVHSGVNFYDLLEELESERISIINEHKVFIKSLITNLTYTKKNYSEDEEYVRYILNRLNDQTGTETHKILGSIEHIIEDEVGSTSSKNIGNLVLLEVVLNDDCAEIKKQHTKNDASLLEDKFRIYGDSRFPEVKRLLTEHTHMSFNNKEVEERAEKIAEKFLTDFIKVEFP